MTEQQQPTLAFGETLAVTTMKTLPFGAFVETNDGAVGLARDLRYGAVVGATKTRQRKPALLTIHRPHVVIRRAVPRQKNARSTDDFLYTQVANRYPDAVECAEIIRTHILTEYHEALPNEEVAFLAVHVQRLAAP